VPLGCKAEKLLELLRVVLAVRVVELVVFLLRQLAVGEEVHRVGLEWLTNTIGMLKKTWPSRYN
jgi:hypothetical protein